MEFFAARQPILNLETELIGYELLFRDGINNAFPDITDEQATLKMVSGLQLSLGLDKLAANKKAFVNFTHDTLLAGYPKMLPADQVVIEILETVKPDKQLLKTCQDLYDSGYTLALDDYEHKTVWKHFYPIISIIKIDIQVIKPKELDALLVAIKPYPHIQLLAECVESYDEFNQYKALGFTYFQGYFFSRPEVIKQASLSPAQGVLAKLSDEMTKPEPDIKELTQTIESDVTLAFKLLRYTQSPMFKREKVIENVKQAVVVLGNQELRRFIALLFGAEICVGKPTELLMLAQTRARFCELVAIHRGQEELQASAFLAGLISMLDAMLDADMQALLASIPISPAIKIALLQHGGEIGAYLRLSEHFEVANWTGIALSCRKLNIPLDIASELTLQSISWATERQSVLN